MQEQGGINFAETIMIRRWKEIVLRKKINNIRQIIIIDFFK